MCKLDTDYPTFSTLLEYLAGVPVIRVAGELDLATRPQLEEALDRAASGSPRVVADLRGLTFIDACGLGLLIQHLNALRSMGGDLLLVDLPEDSPVSRLLRLTGLDEWFPVYTDPGSAARGSAA